MKVISPEDQYEKFKELDRAEVLKLVEWINRQPHLPKIEEIEALLFLHSCWHSVELAKQTIDLNFTIRTLCPEFFSNRNVHDINIKRALKTCAITPLPYTTENGEKIIISKMINSDPSQFVLADTIKLYFMCFDLWLMEEGAASGHILVIDMDGCVPGHVLRLYPFIVKKFLFYLQDACPVRIKGLHFINTVPFMDKVLAIIKPFMKEELLKVMHLHSNLETFYKYVPKECLPKEYGGTKDSFQNHYEKYHEKLLENHNYFVLEETSKRVDETQRPGNPKTTSHLFGVEGNFKKINID